jgi:hypothetical protein
MLDTLKFLQNNVNRNQMAMHICLDIEFEQKIDYIALQEPWIEIDNQITISHPAYYCILSERQNIRPRVVIFARKGSRFQACLRSDITISSDLQIIDIKDKENKLETLQFINIYNEKSLEQGNNIYTVNRDLLHIIPSQNTIICGDFNAHHSWWNEEVMDSIRAEALVNWLKKYELNCLNETDKSILLKENLSRKSIIDLTFINQVDIHHWQW